MISESYRNLIAKHDADTLTWKRATGQAITNEATRVQLEELTQAIKAQHPSMDMSTKEGCSHFSYLNDYQETQGWRKFFSQAGVEPQDIAEVCLLNLPEPLAKQFEGQFSIRFNNVTEEQFRRVSERIAALRANDGVDQQLTHEEFYLALGIERGILAQLRTIHRTKATMVGELKKYITANEPLLKKTCSIIFDTETIFNGDETDQDRDSIVDLIAGGNIEDAGMRLFALEQYGPFPCYDEEGNEPTEADYTEHFDSLYEAAEHWLDTPEAWTAHCGAEREKVVMEDGGPAIVAG